MFVQYYVIEILGKKVFESPVVYVATLLDNEHLYGYGTSRVPKKK